MSTNVKQEFDRAFEPLLTEYVEPSCEYEKAFAGLFNSSRCKIHDIAAQWHMIARSYTLYAQSGMECDIVVRARPDVEIHAFDPVLPGEREIVCTSRSSNQPCDVMFYGRPSAMALATSLSDAVPDCFYWLNEADLVAENIFAEHCRRAGLTITRSSERIRISLVRGDGTRVPLSA